MNGYNNNQQFQQQPVYNPQVMNQKNSSPRPYERVTRFTLVNEDWWQDFNYRAFNLSSTEAEKVMVQADAEHLRIYIPKK